MYHASYCNVYINQWDAQILVNNLYFFVKWLYMFRTIISPSSRASFNKLYSAIGTFMPVHLTAVWIQQGLYPHSSQTYQHECTNCTVQLIKCCPWWWTNDSPKYVEPINKKIKIIHKNLCSSLVYIHIAIRRTVHTTSNHSQTSRFSDRHLYTRASEYAVAFPFTQDTCSTYFNKHQHLRCIWLRVQKNLGEWRSVQTFSLGLTV